MQKIHDEQNIKILNTDMIYQASIMVNWVM